MWQKIISILCVINAFNSILGAIPLSTYNETNLILPLYSQLSDLRSQQEQQATMIERLLTAMDIQTLKSEVQRQGKIIEKVVEDCQEKLSREIPITKLEKEGNLIDKLDKLIGKLVSVTDIQSKKSELKEHNENDETNCKSDIQSLKLEMKRQGVLIDEQRMLIDKQEKLILELVNATDIQSLKADITFLKTELKEHNENDVTNYKSEIQSLKLGMTEQNKLIEEQKMLIDKQEKKQNKVIHPSNCSEAKSSGIFNIVVSNFSSEPFPVACDAETHEGGWTVILKRIDGSVNFYRKWTEYQRGFGDLDGEFFIGLDKLHALTTERTQELLIVLEDFEGNATFAKYDEFAISGEEDKYRLNTLGSYSGTAGDSLGWHSGDKFSTFDNDNDENSGNCAKESTGAWWYNTCHYSNLAGKYKDNNWGKGVNWWHFRGYYYSLKKAIMMIRPRK